ncbi:MAG: efflux RND transporter permease subunit [bacterium]|nr:efflux RND transporter permease subunit [bacterium]
MIGKWSNFFINRYKTTILLVIAIIAVGIFGATNNYRQDFPQISSNYISIYVTYPQAASNDVEKEVVIPIEQSIGDLDGLKYLRSISYDNGGWLGVEMQEVDQVDVAIDEIEKNIKEIGLTSDAKIEVKTEDPIGPLLIYALGSDTTNISELQNEAELVREHFLTASAGIDKIDISPEIKNEIVIALNEEKLKDKGLTLTEVQQVLQSTLLSIPGGVLAVDDGQDMNLIFTSNVTKLSDFEDVQIQDVVLSDIASISMRTYDEDQVNHAGYLLNDIPESKSAVMLIIYTGDKGDAISISEDIAAEAEHINADKILPNNVDLAPVFDNSKYVEKQIGDLLTNGWYGLFLILLVLMLFINFRTGIIVATIIPLAFLITLAALFALGYTINILTLFAMLLVLGIIVDNAIVIAEGVTHNIENGQNKKLAVASAMKELGPPVTAATLTTLVVFIPFANISGVVGAFLRFIPYTIIIMLIASFFLAITITPVLSIFLMKEETKEQRKKRKLSVLQKMFVLPVIIFYGQKLVDFLEDIYGLIITHLFAKWWTKAMLVLTGVTLIAVSVLSFGQELPFEQFPKVDNVEVKLNFDFPKQISADEKKAATISVLDKAVGTEHFHSYFIYEENSVSVIFSEPTNRPDGPDIYALGDKLEEEIASVTKSLAEQGIVVTAESVSIGPPTDPFDVIVELRGDDMDGLTDASADLTEFLENEMGVVQVKNSWSDAMMTDYEIDFNEEELEKYNLDNASVSMMVNLAFSETQVGKISIGTDGVSDDVILALDEESKNSLADARELVLFSTPLEDVTLDKVADITEVESLQQIQRLDELRVAKVSARVSDDTDSKDIEQLVKDYLTEEHLEEFNLSAEDVSYGGFTASMNENYNNLLLVFIIAVIAVYLILVYQFNSFIQPGLILFTIPLAMIGVFPALSFINESINMVSGLGIIALVGIVVNDAIVFVDYFNRISAKNEKWSTTKSMIETGKARFKPILSTSITTVFGILPLTLNDLFWRGLGTSLIAGLIFSTLGTLLVFPVLLSWNESRKKMLDKIIKKCQ